MRLLPLFLLSGLLAYAVPDCHYHYQFNKAQIDGNALTTAPINNQNAACNAYTWSLSYATTQVSTISIQMEAAATTVGQSSPSNFTIIPGTTLAGTNPSTSLSGVYTMQGYFPWVRINVTSATYSSNPAPLIDVYLNGWSSPNAVAHLNSGGGGGGSGTVGNGNTGQYATYPSNGTTVTGHTLLFSDVASLWTGTPTNLNFARGDGTWAVPSGGGGSSFYQTIKAQGSSSLTQRAILNVASTSDFTVTPTDNGTDTTTLTVAATSNLAKLNAANVFTGTNDFSGTTWSRPAVVGAGVPSSGLCNGVGQVGRLYVSSNPAASGASLYSCDNTGVATYQWELIGPGTAFGTGPSGALDCVTFGPSICDVVTALVPLKQNANIWTGANDFSGATSIKPVKVSATPPPCSVVGDIGNAWLDTTSAVTSHYKVCASIASAVNFQTVF